VHAYAYGITTAAVDTLTQSPFIITQEGSDNEVTSGPIHSLFDIPTTLNTGVDLWDLTIRGLLQNPSGVLWQYGFTAPPTPASLPVTIDVINANKFKPVKEHGIFMGWRRMSDSKLFSPLEMVWFRFPDPEDEFMSLTPFRSLARGITDDVEAAQFNSEFFQNGARLGLLLKTDEIVEDEEEARMLRALDDYHSRRGQRFRNLILSGVKWETEDHSTTHRDMEFVEQRRFHREEQRAATRTGPLMLGDVTDGNRSNTVGQVRVYWQNVILPLQKRLARTARQGFFQRFTQARRFVGAFDNTNIEALQADLDMQTDVAKKFHEMGFTANELNEMFEWGFEDSPSRDVVFVQSTMVPAEDLLDGGLAALERADAAAAKPAKERTPEELRIIVAAQHLKGIQQWRAINAQVVPLERAMRGRVARNLLMLRAGVLKRLGKFKDWDSGIEKAPTAGDVDGILFNSTRTGRQFANELDKPLRDAVRRGGNAVISEVGAEGSFDHLSPQVTTYINGRRPPIVGVHETIRASVQRQLLQSIVSGESVAAMMGRVRSVFNTTTARAQLIAITEVNGAFNNGREQSMKKQGIEKIEWLTAGDEDVRDSHKKNNGLIRKRGDKFPNGLTHPHQTGAEAKEVLNCRCAAAPVMSKGALLPFRKDKAS
jgi:SPP1 gp7 family putative phage head morphogenesis protein